MIADAGWRFVVADAGQLEPRILAAVSGDARLAAAAGAGDLYAALAADSFGGDRARAKLALLGAMYGQTGGGALPAIAVLRRATRPPGAYVEAAARTGEAGGLVRSWLGRTCPPATRAAGAVGRRSRAPARPPPGRGGGSPATSSSRPPRPSGRWRCWAACGRRLAGSAPSWCSSSTTRCWCTAPSGGADGCAPR